MSLEFCFLCDCPTGNSGKGDGSLYDSNDEGPYCEECFDKNFRKYKKCEECLSVFPVEEFENHFCDNQ